MILAILVSEMSKSEIFFSFPLHFSSCTDIDTFERRHWSFYVYVCYENGPRIKRELCPWESNRLHPATLVSRENPEDSNRRVDYETRSVHFGYRLRSIVRCRQLRQLANSPKCEYRNPWTLDALDCDDTWSSGCVRVYHEPYNLSPKIFFYPSSINIPFAKVFI